MKTFTNQTLGKICSISHSAQKSQMAIEGIYHGYCE